MSDIRVYKKLCISAWEHVIEKWTRLSQIEGGETVSGEGDCIFCEMFDLLGTPGRFRGYGCPLYTHGTYSCQIKIQRCCDGLYDKWYIAVGGFSRSVGYSPAVREKAKDVLIYIQSRYTDWLREEWMLEIQKGVRARERRRRNG